MATEPKIYEANIEDFIDDPQNANRGTERGHYMIDKSVEATGLHRGVFADRNGVILGGNKTRQAAVDAGYTKAIVVETDGDTLVVTKRRDFDLSDPDNPARLAAYADNRTGQVNLDFDFDVIASDIEAGLDLSDFWFEWELEGLEEEPKKELPPNDTEPQTSRADELRELWGVELGQLWRLPSRVEGQEHLLICGDCTDPVVVARMMGGEKADMFLTDPPYGVSYASKNEWLNAVAFGNRIQTPIKNDHGDIEDIAQDVWLPSFSLALECCCDTSSFYLFMPQGGDQMMMMMMMNEAGWMPRHELIWLKNNHVLGRADYNYKHEPILYGWKRNGTHKFYGDFQTSVIEFPKPQSSKLHPTTKPVELIQYLIPNNTQLGQFVYDPFGGSGTTMVASENLGRQCRMIEIEPSYCAVTLDRYERAFNIKPELVKGELVK